MDKKRSLYYRIAAPKKAQGDRWPTIIIMHGRGSNEEDLLGLHPYLPPEWAMVSLRAPEPIGPHQYQWYGLQTQWNPDMRSLEDSLNAVEAFLTEVPTEIPAIDVNRWILGGFSQGGLMTAALLQRRLAKPPLGSIILSGYLPDQVVLDRPLSGTPIFWGHGKQDQVLPVTWAHSGVARLERLGADVTYKLYSGLGHSVDDQELDDLNNWLFLRGGVEAGET